MPPLLQAHPCLRSLAVPLAVHQILPPGLPSDFHPPLPHCTAAVRQAARLGLPGPPLCSPCRGEGETGSRGREEEFGVGAGEAEEEERGEVETKEKRERGSRRQRIEKGRGGRGGQATA